MTKPAENVTDLDARRKARGVAKKVVRVNGKNFNMPGVLPLSAAEALIPLIESGGAVGGDIGAVVGPLEEIFGPVVRELTLGPELPDELGAIMAMYGLSLGE